MRQWFYDPSKMCTKHLLGEHVEHHMFVGTINKGTSINGYLRNNLLEPLSLQARHDEIVLEMKRRGFNHKTPLPEVDFSKLTNEQKLHKVDKERSASDLLGRCTECR